MITRRAGTASARLGWYWTCQAIGWIAVALVNLGFSAAYMPDKSLAFLAIYGWSAACGIVLSHVWRGFLRRHAWLVGARRTPWGRLAGCIVLLGALQVSLVAAAFFVVRPTGPVSGFGWLPTALLFWIFIFLVWTTLYGSVSAMRRARRFESEALRLEILAKDAELRALQAQVNPHFFFNSLNSVRALIFESPPAAAQMIDQLASLMRYALQYGGATSVSLAQEMDAVQAYLAIEKIRFEERLRTRIEIAPDLLERRIPPMAIQTLVENAVKYGVERSADGCEIRIVMRDVDGELRIEIANQGTLLPYADSTRIGLENTRRRLALSFGARAHVELGERDGWVTARLRIPASA